MNIRESQKEKTITNILEVAEKLFYAQGYENTSIAQIAKECGLSKGAMYHHFVSKEAVLNEICLNYYKFLKEKFMPIANNDKLTMSEKIYETMKIARSMQLNTSATSFVKPKKANTFSVENAAVNQLLGKYAQKIYTEVFSIIFEVGKNNDECAFPCSAKTIANLIFNLDISTTEQLNSIIFDDKIQDKKKSVNDTIAGFVFALSQLLSIDSEKIAEILLIHELKQKYKELITTL